MKEDPELGYILAPSINYNHDIPDNWFYTSKEIDIYDTSGIEETAMDQFLWMGKAEDVYVSNPCIFTGNRGFMFIGFIVKVILPQQISEADFDNDSFDFTRRFIGKDYVTFICANNMGELEWLCDDYDLFDPDDLMVTQWPFCVVLPDSTI